ncbi:MAG: hypothetical protein R3C60_06735 [Parvularculaceae bacterium]
MKPGYLAVTGLICCVIALVIQLFPWLAYSLGVDMAASWRLFGFGLFLIAISVLTSSRQAS